MLLIHNIKKNFEQAKKDDADRVLIYYSGHGDKDTGGWVTYNDGGININNTRLTMFEILDII
jgi:hypothetical protein